MITKVLQKSVGYPYIIQDFTRPFRLSISGTEFEFNSKLEYDTKYVENPHILHRAVQSVHDCVHKDILSKILELLINHEDITSERRENYLCSPEYFHNLIEEKSLVDDYLKQTDSYSMLIDNSTYEIITSLNDKIPNYLIGFNDCAIKFGIIEKNFSHRNCEVMLSVKASIDIVGKISRKLIND